ncbi:hypothetical protein [Luteolibacter sp. LG18]|uniref:hypothetical protein n=1 Tax=Luteolibacter sp. LG18 TaxID=2819286 RepID=UPI002B2E172F|nr:hypothetical protein llg_12650 [Luteolibacter sp. LG18]
MKIGAHLVATLLHHEQEKGSPLTEAEVIAIRDQAPCVMSPRDAFEKARESRGYDDIDPEDCWNGWQVVRKGLL